MAMKPVEGHPPCCPNDKAYVSVQGCKGSNVRLCCSSDGKLLANRSASSCPPPTNHIACARSVSISQTYCECQSSCATEVLDGHTWVALMTRSRSGGLMLLMPQYRFLASLEWRTTHTCTSSLNLIQLFMRLNLLMRTHQVAVDRLSCDTSKRARMPASEAAGCKRYPMRSQTCTLQCMSSPSGPPQYLVTSPNISSVLGGERSIAHNSDAARKVLPDCCTHWVQVWRRPMELCGMCLHPGDYAVRLLPNMLSSQLGASGMSQDGSQGQCMPWAAGSWRPPHNGAKHMMGAHMWHTW